MASLDVERIREIHQGTDDLKATFDLLGVYRSMTADEIAEEFRELRITGQLGDTQGHPIASRLRAAGVKTVGIKGYAIELHGASIQMHGSLEQLCMGINVGKYPWTITKEC